MSAPAINNYGIVQTVSGSAGVHTLATGSTIMPYPEGVYWMNIYNNDGTANVYIMPPDATVTGSFSAKIIKPGENKTWGPVRRADVPTLATDADVVDTVLVDFDALVSSGR